MIFSSNHHDIKKYRYRNETNETDFTTIFITFQLPKIVTIKRVTMKQTVVVGKENIGKVGDQFLVNRYCYYFPNGLCPNKSYI